MPLNDGTTSQILPFCPEGTEAAGDIMSLETYASSTLRLRGHQQGMARRELQNRAMRQVSLVAAGLAQYMANRYAEGVLDNGNLDAIESAMVAAVQAQINATAPPAATDIVAGVVELATATEVQTGTDAARAVTPAGLAARTATATRAGIVELATVAEATTGTDATRAVTPQGLAAAIAATVIVAPGEIIAFAASTAPTGYLKCNGAAVSRTTYASLFAVVGTTFGAGNGSTTFNLPDLRGEFVRGWDDGRGVDTGRVIGSAQGDAIRNITGTLAYQDDGLPAAVQTATGAFAATPAISTTILNGSGAGGNYSISAKLDVSLVVPTAAENRPRNVAVLYCIKY